MQKTPYEDVMQVIKAHRAAGVPQTDLLATLIRVQEELTHSLSQSAENDEDAFENMPV